jgi:hypothetical protein
MMRYISQGMLLFFFTANLVTISNSIYKKSRISFCIAAQFMLSMICRELTDVLTGDESSNEFNNGGNIIDTNKASLNTAEDERFKEKHRTLFTQISDEADAGQGDGKGEGEGEGLSLSWSTDAMPDMDDFMDVTHLIPFNPW